MVTAKNRKAMTKAQRGDLIRWLKFYDRWLWMDRTPSRKACEFAVSDGLTFATPNRLAIMAGKEDVCEHWKVEHRDPSSKFILNSKSWNRLFDWIVNHKDEILEAGSVVAASVLASRAGVHFSTNAMREALHARGIKLPDRSERPKYAPPGGIPKTDDTPTITQWRAFKQKQQGFLILMRIGDFYETFHEDAEALHKLAGVTLTKRGDAVMAGVPVTSVESTLRVLIASGRKVAICEPVEGKGKSSKVEIERLVGTTAEAES
jgi:hypothetical protein